MSIHPVLGRSSISSFKKLPLISVPVSIVIVVKHALLAFIKSVDLARALKKVSREDLKLLEHGSSLEDLEVIKSLKERFACHFQKVSKHIVNIATLGLSPLLNQVTSSCE